MRLNYLSCQIYAHHHCLAGDNTGAAYIRRKNLTVVEGFTRLPYIKCTVLFYSKREGNPSNWTSVVKISHAETILRAFEGF